MLKENLYNKYGGYQTIKNLTIEFYERVNRQKTLAQFFVKMDMPTLIEHQTKFLCQALGGPAHYSGRELKKAHGSLRISEKDFADVARILQETLLDGGMSPEDTANAMAIIGSTKKDIVSSHA